jgi:23S rRNA pseudouridine2605 synthase
VRERLQKVLAAAGVASRRAAEVLIVEGRVRVNGKIVTELGTSADPRRDRIEVDGKRVVRESVHYFLLHKPRAMVSTMKDPEGRASIGELVARIGVRVVPVGRLDFHTSGALLLTNDGELTDALLHPRREVPKVYAAKVRGRIDVPELDALRNGVVLDDGVKTKPADIFVLREDGKSTWLQITLYEGKNRQIHRMGDAIGHPVLRLARLSFAGIDTDGLKPGQFRPLTERELERLKRDYVTPRNRAVKEAQRKARHGVSDATLDQLDDD